MADGRHLGSGPTGSSAIRSVDPENPILAPNGWPIAEIWPFKIFQHGRLPHDQIRNLVKWPWPHPFQRLPKMYFIRGVKGNSKFFNMAAKFGEDQSKSELSMLAVVTRWTVTGRMNGHRMDGQTDAKGIYVLSNAVDCIGQTINLSNRNSC